METKEKQKINIHSGHRERLRAQIQKTGLYNMSDIHFLEYLLTFVIKRSDTNPIAHALLNEFGSISNIFNASTFALMQVKGVGEQTARFLQYMSVVVHMHNKALAKNILKLDTINNISNYVTCTLPPSENEQFMIIVVNKNYSVKEYKIFKGVSHSFISIDKNEIAEYLINHKSSFLIFAHTHPHHSAMPSLSDLETFNTIQPLLDSLCIVLVENIIIGDEHIYSLKTKQLFDKKFDSK